jgi:hypothetical protein
MTNDFTFDVQEVRRKQDVFDFKQSDEKDYVYTYKLKDLLGLFGTRKKSEKYHIIKVVCNKCNRDIIVRKTHKFEKEKTTDYLVIVNHTDKIVEIGKRYQRAETDKIKQELQGKFPDYKIKTVE